MSLFLPALLLSYSDAQGVSDTELARMLARDDTREQAISIVIADRRARTPLLLAWADRPPAGVDELGLTVGCATPLGE